MPNIRHNLTIEVPIERVYEAITSENGLKGWWTTNTMAKPELGYINHFRFGEEYFNKMKILNLIDSSLIEWECVDGDHEWVGTRLTFELELRDEKTFLKFSHLDWKEESEFFGFCSHHWGRFLDSLKAFCETGQGHPYHAG